jgi:hypothetical protein
MCPVRKWGSNTIEREKLEGKGRVPLVSTPGKQRPVLSLPPVTYGKAVLSADRLWSRRQHYTPAGFDVKPLFTGVTSDLKVGPLLQREL